MNVVKIKTRNNLYRDMDSGAVINTNRAEYENYLSRKQRNAEINKQLDKNCQEIAEIKNELSEVKNLLLAMIKQENN